MTNQSKIDKGWTPEEIDSLKGKTFVITGATSGTGYQAVRRSYRRCSKLGL